ncbi:NAD(P)H-quinone oxidoreductase subunit 2, chloroplastic [Streptomyces hirsutus]
MSSLVQSVDWLAIAPPVIAALVGLAVLVADLFVGEARKPLLGWLAVTGLAAATLMLLPLLDADRSTFCLVGDPGVCSYTADRFTLVIQFLVLGGALLTALLSVTALKDADKRLPEGEYWFLFLSSVAGAALLPASRDLATLVVALEVASLPAFALVGLRHGDRKSSEAALKFFLSSVTATTVSLLGISFVYAATGTLHLTLVAERVQTVDGQLHTLAQTGVVLTLVGFAFKTAAVPFHFWVPDTYVGAPLPIAAYLSVIGKAVGFTGLILVTVVALPSYAEVWGPALAALAALTMTVGNVGALGQQAARAYSAVRLLAWSSVGQAGYLLVPIAAAAYSGDAEKSIGSTLAYALMYGAVNLGAFAVAALVGRTKALNRVSDYRGLYASSPLTALLLAFFLLCLAGLPPGIIGLFAKVTVFSAAVDAGLGWLAVVMAVNVVIALVYYLRWTATGRPGPTRNATRSRPAMGSPCHGPAGPRPDRGGLPPGDPPPPYPVCGRAHRQHPRAEGYGHPRQRERQDQTPGEPDRRQHPRHRPRPKRPGRRVGHRVVHQHPEGGEPDRTPYIHRGSQDGDHRSHGRLRPVRHLEPRVDGGQEARKMPVPGHGQHRPRDTQDQGEQRTQRGRGRPHPYHRRQFRNPGRPHRVGQRRARIAQPPGPQHRKDRDRDSHVHDQCDAQRQRDRAPDGARRIPYLLAEGRDPRVPGEGEEQQTGGLKHAARAARCRARRGVRQRPVPRSGTRPPRKARTARTTATMHPRQPCRTSAPRRSHRGQAPRQLRPPPRGPARGQRYAPTVSAIAAQEAVFPTTNAQPARSPPELPEPLTATGTGTGPLISSRVRPAVEEPSTSSARTAATSSRGTEPRPVWASRRTRPVPASSVSMPGRRIVHSRASRPRTYASASPLARWYTSKTSSPSWAGSAPIDETTTNRRTPARTAASAKRTAAALSTVSLRAVPLPGPAPAANTAASAPRSCSATSATEADSRSSTTGSAPNCRSASACSALRMMPATSSPRATSNRSSRSAI